MWKSHKYQSNPNTGTRKGKNIQTTLGMFGSIGALIGNPSQDLFVIFPLDVRERKVRS